MLTDASVIKFDSAYFGFNLVLKSVSKYLYCDDPRLRWVHVPGDFEEVHAIIEEQRNTTHKCPLAKVVEVALPNNMGSNLAKYKPKSNPWQFPEEVLAILPDFEEKIKCLIFRQIFSCIAERLDLSTATFWRAFQGLWKEVIQEWDALCAKMIDGSITLASAEKVFSLFKAEEGSYNFTEVEADMLKMSASTGGAVDWVDKRIKQFSCYMDIKKYVAAATALLDVKDAFAIQGNFDDIEKICSLVRKKLFWVKRPSVSV